MIKLSKLSDYAVVVLAALVSARGRLLTASGLAQTTHIPEPTVAKVLKLLSKQGIIDSTRGVHGGYAMTRDPASITIHELIIALEGPVAITACTNDSLEICTVQNLCKLRGSWQKINDAITSTLDSMYLHDLLTDVHPMDKGR